MKRKKHKPPSRERYEKNNPVWSVRMPKELIETLEAELKLNGQSKREFIGVALKKQMLNVEEIRVTSRKKGYDQGYEKGYQDGDKKGYDRGMNEWAIWGYCHKCNKKIFFKRDSPNHETMVEVTQGYLEHSQCPDR
jgi:flagellar biosynthesis/type III secretory pathway protein FliH